MSLNKVLLIIINNQFRRILHAQQHMGRFTNEPGYSQCARKTLFYCNLKMLGLYLYTLIICDKSRNMLSILNKLT